MVFHMCCCGAKLMRVTCLLCGACSAVERRGRCECDGHAMRAARAARPDGGSRGLHPPQGNGLCFERERCSSHSTDVINFTRCRSLRVYAVPHWIY